MTSADQPHPVRVAGGSSRRALLFGGAAAAGAIVAAAAIPDWWLIRRRLTLPKELPWPWTFFQPQERVAGGAPRQFPAADPATTTIAPAALEEAVAYAREIGSTAFLVWRRGRVEKAWYAPGTGPETITHTYHMQYTVLVLLVGIAMAEGKIGPAGTPAATYLPEWKDEARRRITLRHLLQMNAGLDLRFDANKSDGFFARDARAYWGAHTKEVILTYPSVHPAGSRFDYNYIVPELLGIILERATGRRYADYMAEKLWQPLGNRDAYLWLNRLGGEAHQDAGLFSSPADWLNVGILLLQNGRIDDRQIVPEAWIAEMRMPSPTNPNFGYMWLGSPFAPARRLATDPRVTYVVKSAEPFAAGDISYIDGYGGQRAYVVPSRDLVVVRLGDVARNYDNARPVNTLIRGIA
jgi:CubicO group peptidase (beta-lactamase class C family)